jgi:hypothetical protein
MIVKKKTEDLSKKIQAATAEAMKKLLAETKAKNSYLVFSDKDGNIKRVEAKDL